MTLLLAKNLSRPGFERYPGGRFLPPAYIYAKLLVLRLIRGDLCVGYVLNKPESFQGENLSIIPLSGWEDKEVEEIQQQNITFYKKKQSRLVCVEKEWYNNI